VWVILNEAAITGTTRSSTREVADGTNLTLVIATAAGTDSSVSVTPAELNGAGPDGDLGTDDDVSVMIAVESVQGTASADNQWKRTAAVALAAKSSGS